MAPKRHDGIASNHSMMPEARLFTRAHIQTGVDRVRDGLPLISWITTSGVC